MKIKIQRHVLWAGIAVLLSIIASMLAYSVCARNITYTEEALAYDAYSAKYEVQTGYVTGYNSVPEQTDDTPYQTASGACVRDGIVANNCLAFGTKVEIGGKTYEVQDRMNSRYDCDHFDIWFAELADAQELGIKQLPVKVFLP